MKLLLQLAKGNDLLNDLFGLVGAQGAIHERALPWLQTTSHQPGGLCGMFEVDRHVYCLLAAGGGAPIDDDETKSAAAAAEFLILRRIRVRTRTLHAFDLFSAAGFLSIGVTFGQV